MLLYTNLNLKLLKIYIYHKSLIFLKFLQDVYKRQLLSKKLYTYEDLTKKLGLKSKGTITKYANGQIKNPSISTIEKIAKLYNISPAWLSGLSNNKHANMNTDEFIKIKIVNQSNENSLDSFITVSYTHLFKDCLAICTTSLVFSFAYTGIFNCAPTTCNCFIAAGLYTSHATKSGFLPCFLNIFASLPEVVDVYKRQAL